MKFNWSYQGRNYFASLSSISIKFSRNAFPPYQARLSMPYSKEYRVASCKYLTRMGAFVANLYTYSSFWRIFFIFLSAASKASFIFYRYGWLQLEILNMQQKHPLYHCWVRTSIVCRIWIGRKDSDILPLRVHILWLGKIGVRDRIMNTYWGWLLSSFLSSLLLSGWASDIIF